MSGDNYILTIINNGGSGTYANGENVDIDAEVDAGNLTAYLWCWQPVVRLVGAGLGSWLLPSHLTALVSKNTSPAKKLKTAWQDAGL